MIVVPVICHNSNTEGFVGYLLQSQCRRRASVENCFIKILSVAGIVSRCDCRSSREASPVSAGSDW